MFGGTSGKVRTGMENNDEKKRNSLDGKERLRGIFTKFFEKFDLKEEKKLNSLGRALIFIFFFVLEGLVYMQMFATPKTEDFQTKFLIFTIAAGAFDVVEALNMFVLKTNRAKVVCYIFDILALVTMLAVTGNSYLCVLYMLVLTEFYMSAKRTRSVVLTFAFSLPLYVVVNWLALTIFLERTVSYTYVISNTLGALVFLTAHFVIVNFGLGFYRQYVRLEKALKDLDENRNELKKANEELLVAAATMERQRIAKEIHDTAGHSITTVIMQTEAAKLVIEKDPLEAKKRIVAANLQAKHALEELRESVHLLSGRGETASLKSAFEQIIQESSDGTDIKIRSEIEEIETDGETYRFLCNALKEGISNGIRHGRATAFWVELKKTEEDISFLLSDNGEGIELSALQKGFGLSGMAQHAQRLGGKAEFLSEEGEGFEIRIRIGGAQGADD